MNPPEGLWVTADTDLLRSARCSRPSCCESTGACALAPLPNRCCSPANGSGQPCTHSGSRTFDRGTAEPGRKMR